MTVHVHVGLKPFAYDPAKQARYEAFQSGQRLHSGGQRNSKEQRSSKKIVNHFCCDFPYFRPRVSRNDRVGETEREGGVCSD